MQTIQRGAEEWSDSSHGASQLRTSLTRKVDDLSGLDCRNVLGIFRTEPFTNSLLVCLVSNDGACGTVHCFVDFLNLIDAFDHPTFVLADVLGELNGISDYILCSYDTSTLELFIPL